MPRKNRAYKKGVPHRDARLFVIVAEGEREDAYFRFFHAQNQRIKIKVVPREGGKSAPKYFLARVDQFRSTEEWVPEVNDQLWFVLDVDRWERKDIDELYAHCRQTATWNLAISNPCFEVWLWYHQVARIDLPAPTCKVLKTRLDQLSPGGYTLEQDALQIETAMRQAQQVDAHPDHYFPASKETKVYQLARELLAVLGQNWADQ